MHIAAAAWMLAALSFAIPAFAHDPVEHQQPVAASAIPADPEAPFLAENDRAMTTMMNGMAVRPTGNVERDFVEMMIPHHQGAIDMAQAYLRYGNNEQLKRIAQEIIVDQQQEIAAMRLALGDPLPPSVAAPTQLDPQPPASADPAMSSMPDMSSMPGMDPSMKMGH
jgi:methionine-rich copper-binding protein CopC